MIQVLFFASLREQLDCAEQQISAQDVTCVADIKLNLVTANPTWQAALADRNLLCAVNQELVNSSHLVKDGDEVAFFPPVTGG